MGIVYMAVFLVYFLVLGHFYTLAYNNALESNMEALRSSKFPNVMTMYHPYYEEDGVLYVAKNRKLISKKPKFGDLYESKFVYLRFEKDGKHVHRIGDVFSDGTIWVENSTVDIEYEDTIPVERYTGN